MTKEISTKELHEVLAKGLTPDEILVDVRNEWEFEANSIKEAKNIPLRDLQMHTDELSKFNKVYFICRSGGSSAYACEIMHNLGVKEAINVEGGMTAF